MLDCIIRVKSVWLFQSTIFEVIGLPEYVGYLSHKVKKFTPFFSGDHVLTSHKPKKEEEIPVALALFEPPDPTKKPMYCKHLVYQGVTEFQFEELRAARYRQKVAREEVNQV